MKVDPAAYLPFISISLAVWSFLSATIVEATSIFQANANVITSTSVPYSTFVLRCVARNVIVAGHYSLVVLITFAVCRYQIHWVALATLPGIVLLCANLVWISLAVGLICARYRDVAQMVIYLMQLAMFLTPIIWQPSQVRAGSAFLLINPLYHLVEIVRAPLFEGRLPVQSILFSLGMLVVGSALSTLAFTKFRRALVFWI